MKITSRLNRTVRFRLLALAITMAAVGSLAQAGSIFDDDYVPPAPLTPPSVTLPERSNAPTVPGPDAPTPPPSTDPAVPPHDATVQPPAQPLLAVPAPADQAQSRKLFKQAFATELKDNSQSARLALAARLLAEADKVADNPCDRFVLLVGACDAATEGGDLHLANRAAQTTATLYKVDALHLSANAALKTPLKVSSPTQAAEAIDEEMELESKIAQSGDYSTATRLLASMQPLAARDSEVGSLLKERTRQLTEMRAAHDRAQAAAERLKKTPDDPAGNSSVGEFLCFVSGDFEHGLTPLARGSDPAIRQAAQRDLDLAADSKQQIAIGDGWWDLNEKKNTRELFRPAMRSRACFWYAKALAGGQVTGLERTILDRRIASASAGGRDVVFLSAMKETKVDGIVVDSNFGLAKNSINPQSKKPITVDGVEYAHGLGFNPNGGGVAHIVYDLGGKCRRFTGAVGVNDTAGSFEATLTFKIVADGKELWRSRPLKTTKTIEKFNVSVYNVKVLELQLDCNGPGHNAHCVWIEPRLEAR